MLQKKPVMRTTIVIMSIALGGCVTKGENTNDQLKLNTFPVVQLALTDTILQKNYVADIQAVRNV